MKYSVILINFILFFSLISFEGSSQPWNSREGLDSLLRLLPAAKEDSAKSLLQEFISYCYLSIDPDSAIIYAKEEMATAKRIGWKKGIANGYADLGNCYQVKGDFSGALSNYFKGLAIYEDLNFKFGVSALSNNIANIYYSQEQFDNALTYYFKALLVKKPLNDTISVYAGMEQEIYHELANIGNVYKDMGDDKKALYYYTIAKENAIKVGSAEGVQSCLIGLGSVHNDQQNYLLALEELHEAMEMAQSSSSTLDLGFIYACLGQSHIGIYKNTNGTIRSTFAPEGKRENLTLAVNYITRGIEIFRELGYNSQLDKQLFYLYEAHSLQGDYKKALEAYKEYTDIRDTLFSSENTQKIKIIETQRELDLRNKDIRIAELEVAKKRNERGFFIGGIILLLIAMAVVVKNIQRRKLQEKQAAQLRTMVDTQESERKRISRDLHDDIGTKLSALGLFLSSMKKKAEKNGDSELKDLAASSEQFIKEAVKDLRQLLLDLSPSVLEDFGYFTAVETLVNKINETKLIHFNLVIFGIKERLNKDYELALYRITQELVNNVLKHAWAKNVSLQIGRRDNLIILMIEDDGKGFEMVTQMQGYGLKNLTSRTELLSGKMTIDTAPGNGTSVLIEIPYPAAIN